MGQTLRNNPSGPLIIYSVSFILLQSNLTLTVDGNGSKGNTLRSLTKWKVINDKYTETVWKIGGIWTKE